MKQQKRKIYNPLGVKPLSTEPRQKWRGEGDYYRTICCQLYNSCSLESRIIPEVWYPQYTTLNFERCTMINKRLKQMPPQIWNVNFDADSEALIDKFVSILNHLHHAARIKSLREAPMCYCSDTKLNQDAIRRGAAQFVNYDLLYLKALKNAEDYEIKGNSTNTYPI